ncbi:MAG: response regulator transcription factor [Clostridium sp.]|nr:response regulator transcription factor [Clostridium sp.]MBP3215825.1 response regulator transcription factor [Clostridium sp.]MBQ5421546.1 response regulator transcription factor [Clostridium sp.]
MAYSVLIADDQSMARQLFEMFVKSSEKYRLVHSLESASVAHIYCSRFPIDLVLMDVVMADGVSGLEAAKRIKKVSPKTKIIIVTSMPEVSYIKRAREIGVESFWYKEASREPILSVMDRTMAGESVYPDSAPVLTLGNAKSVEFTPKELEVLREMTMGLTNSAIAEKLFIDVTTVKSHVTHMLQKTGFQNRTELAIQARVSGLVIGEPEEETEKKR